MNTIPSTADPQPDQAQFEALIKQCLDLQNPNFRKTPGGAYVDNLIFRRWLTWRDGWIACSAQKTVPGNLAEAIKHATDMVANHGPSHRECIVARSFLALVSSSAQQAPVKAIPLVFKEWRNDYFVAPTIFGSFSVDKSNYRKGYAACLDNENIGPDQTLSTILSADDAKAVCQAAFNRLVLELVERPKSCT